MMREWILRLLLALLTFSATLKATAQDTGVSFTIHNHFVAPRALGMGNAFVAVANDYSALFYNPAGLARREDGEVNLFLDAAASTSFMTASKEFNEASSMEGSEADRTQATMEVIEKYYGKPFSMRLAPANGIWVRPGWGIGVIPADVSVELVMHQGFGPSINLTVYADTTVAFGYGADFRGMTAGRMSWGVTGKFVNRGYFSKSVSAIEMASDPSLVRSEDMREGYTLDADLGWLFTPALPADGILSWFRAARPTFGAVLRNAAESGFTRSLKIINKEPTEAPEKMYRVLDVGSKWEYPSAWIFSGRGVLDIKNIMHPAWNFRKGLHLGFEFDWTMNDWWKGAYRFGLNQGFFSAGLSAKFGIFNADLVTYAEDVGTYNQPLENRMYMARLNINF